MAVVMRAVTLPEPDSARTRRASDTDAALIERSRRDPERFAEVFDRHYVPRGMLAQ